MNERLNEIEKQIINLQEEKKNIYEELNKRQCELENEITDIINQLSAKLTDFYACGGSGQYHIRIADNMSYVINKFFSIDELFNDETIKEYVRDNEYPTTIWSEQEVADDLTDAWVFFDSDEEDIMDSFGEKVVIDYFKKHINVEFKKGE